MKFINRYLKGYRLKLVYCLIACIIASFLSLMTGLVISYLVDHVIGNQPITNPILVFISQTMFSPELIRANFWWIGILIVGINALLVIFLYFRYYLQTSISERLAENIRNDAYDHLQRLTYDYHVNAKTGDLVQRCTSDVDTIRRFFAGQFQELISSLALAIIAVSILLSINVQLTIFAVLLMPVMFIYAYFFFKKVQKVFLSLDEAEGDLTAYAQEVLSGIRVIKAFNKETYELERFKVKNDLFKTEDFRLIKVLGQYWTSSDLICLSQILLVIVVGIFFAKNQIITVGNYVVFMSYVTMIVWPIRNIGRLLADMGKMKVSIGRLQEIFDEPQEILSVGNTPVIKGKIEFKDVTFAYGENQVLKGLNLEILPGETVAIIGPTASGKSSLISLLNRLYDADQGEILIDDQPIKSINPQHLRQNIGLVLQEPFLFSKSILENIKIAARNADDLLIKKAAKNAFIHDDIESFEQGYETLVGEKGVTLSGGQKQRIAIARTIINQTPIVIFDDSLSAVDSETDKGIREALKEINHHTTTLIITQRVNSAMDADKIVVLEDGVITQVGTHEQLIVQTGLYQRIYEIQSQIVKEEI